MKKRLFLFLLTTVLLVGAFALAASASSPANTVAEGTCGEGLTWVIDEVGTLTVSGTGAMEDYYGSSSAPWWSYRNSIRFVVFEEGVTTIGSWNFYEYSSLTGVAIPSSVTTIGDSAFYRCSGLTSVTIPMGVITIDDSAFYRCSGLISVTISSGVTTIGDSAFSGCNSLSSITIPSSVTSIGSYAFNGCSSLTSITIPDGVTSIGESAFGNCSGLTSISFPASVISLGGANAFDGCSSLAAIHVDENNKIYSDMDGILFNKTQSQLIRFPSAMVDTAYTIPSSVTAIGGYAFHDCSNLTSITIPPSVNLIGYCAFYGCSNLMSITIPEGVTSISDHAFSYCENLTSVTLPASVTSIGKYTFWNCSDLTSITIPEGVTSIDYAAFQYCSSLKSMTVPSGVVSISGATFNGCSSLSSITISSSVTSIGDLAFRNCSSLTNITIPSSVIAIGESAFSDCSSLTNVTIPSSVITIGESAFSDCSKMTSITIPSSVTSIGNYAFSRCTGLTIHGNAGSAAELYAINNAIPFAALPIEVIVASGTCGDALTWKLDDAGTLTISGTGEMTDFASLYHLPWANFVNSIESVVIEEGVTNISRVCFFRHENLKWIKIPASVMTISTDFDYTPSLLNIEVDENNPNYSDIDGILFNKDQSKLCRFPEGRSDTAYTVPMRVTLIGSYAFSDCTNLASITIPASVNSIGISAFRGCTNLSAFSVAEGNTAFTAIDGVLFSADKTQLVAYPVRKSATDYSIPAGVTAIADHAFRACANLTDIRIPSSVISLGYGAFSGCSSLTSITIPDSVTWIGGSAFHGCTNLTSVSIPDGVTNIGYQAFMNCTSLASITLPVSVVSIDSSAFSGCTNLTIHGYADSVAETYATENSIPFEVISGSITGTCGENLTWKLDDAGTLTISGTGEMINYGYNNQPWKGHLESITSIVIEEGATSIVGWAFNGCVNLASITLPDSLISIGSAAFIYCESLTALHIPAGVTEIGRWAFSECISLPAFTVAEGNTAFSVDAEGVLFDKNKTILVAYPDGKTDATYIIPEGVTTVGEFAFNLCDSLTSVTLPQSLKTLSDGAFEDCIGLTSITIPAGVSEIGGRAFEACSSLTAFAVEEGNTAFVVIDGVLFSADKTRLVSYPAGKPTANYTIPDGVTAIDSLLFYQCSNLTDITIPSSVTSIGSSAFFGCTDFTIHGYSGSTAEAYAASNNIPFVALQAETIAVTVNIPSSLGSAVTVPEGGWKVGENTFSVKAETACVVAVSYDGGKTYTRLTATANTDGSYNFTAANMTADTVVAVALRGDANGDGKISNADVARAKAAYLGKISLDSLGKIITDANGDGKISNADVARAKAVYLGKTSLGWD